MAQRNIIYLLVCLIIFSCKGTSNPKAIDTSATGSIKRVYIDTSDGLKTEQLFTKRGENLIANGYQKKIDSNGRLVSLYFFKNGNRDSVGQTFFDNGNTKNKWFFNHGIAYGPIYTYYRNGVLAKFEEAMMPDLHFFTVRYDSFGRIESADGAAMWASLMDGRKVYHLSDTANIGFQLTIPENCNFIFAIESVGKNRKKRSRALINDLKRLTFYSDLNMYAHVESYLCKEGSASLIAKLSLLDKKTDKPICTQSARIKIDVK